MAEEVLRLVGVSKRFGPLAANDSISLSLAAGEVLGVLGENGAGKTTLMNIIFGHYAADEGHVEAFGARLPPGSPEAAIKAGIGMVHQHFTLADNLTVLENTILGREPLWSLRQRMDRGRQRLLEISRRFGLETDPDARVGSLTIGQRQRVEILKSLYAEARILILDEPTAVLTPQETENLFATLKKLVGNGLSAIIISHKLREILSISDRIAVLRRGKLVSVVQADGANRDQLAEQMVGRKVARPQAERLDPGQEILRLDGVSTRTGGADIRDVDLVVHSREIVGIAGVSGNGQNSLSGVVCGTLPARAGSITVDGRKLAKLTPRAAVDAGIGRIPEDRHAEGIVGDMTVWENLIGEDLRSPDFTRRRYFLDKAGARKHAASLIDSFSIRCPGPDAETRLLSGGNLQKLILARGLSRQPRLVVANQPTRGLDEGAIAYVQRQLLEIRRRGAGILLISEDLDELLELSDRLMVMYRGQLRPVESRSASQVGLMMSGQMQPAAP